jgi:hypothetical protein
MAPPIGRPVWASMVRTWIVWAAPVEAARNAKAIALTSFPIGGITQQD